MKPQMAFQLALARLIGIIGVPFILMTAAVAYGGAQLTIDADSQYRYAQSRLDTDAFDEAIAEFSRFIHFFPADPRVPQAHFQIGLAHFDAGRYPEAAAIFQSQTAVYASSSLDNRAFFMLSRSHAAQGMIEQAMVDLHNLMALSPPAEVIDRALYELGWLHVDQGRWKLADQAFGRIGAGTRERLEIDDLTRVLADSRTLPVKNPILAGALSIVPGAGQFYCGRYQDSLTALVLNAGLIWAAWEAFDDENYALGSVIGFVEFGFYTGNIYGAISSAQKYNRDRAGELRERLYPFRQMTLSLAPVPHGGVLCLKADF